MRLGDDVFCCMLLEAEIFLKGAMGLSRRDRNQVIFLCSRLTVDLLRCTRYTLSFEAFFFPGGLFCRHTVR